MTGAMVCTSCCGVHRTSAKCGDCEYYAEPRRKYHEVPSYTIDDMESDLDLVASANTIESALCAFDLTLESTLLDIEALDILEKLIDVLYFGDEEVKSYSKVVIDGFEYCMDAIRTDLDDVDNVVITKLLAIIWFVARRRTDHRREYLDFIQDYVGPRIGPGMRVMPNFL